MAQDRVPDLQHLDAGQQDRAGVEGAIQEGEGCRNRAIDSDVQAFPFGEEALVEERVVEREGMEDEPDATLAVAEEPVRIDVDVFALDDDAPTTVSPKGAARRIPIG